ncbi:MAG: hypothetical protein JWM16_610 [Verrucomicrobiales bacterium]|nr:hypothetical protein [Verrucomicrobiales bacterium]
MGRVGEITIWQVKHDRKNDDQNLMCTEDSEWGMSRKRLKMYKRRQERMWLQGTVQGIGSDLNLFREDREGHKEGSGGWLMWWSFAVPSSLRVPCIFFATQGGNTHLSCRLYREEKASKGS